MNHAKGAPERSISRVGLTALIALVSIAAVGMYMGPSSSAATSGTGSASASPVGPEQVAGFRSDAWHLPDTELLGFVEISEGPFLMGGDVTTDPQALDHERWSAASAQGMVNVPTFYIGRSEVTVAQFRAFVEATGFAADVRVFQAPPLNILYGPSRGPMPSRTAVGFRAKWKPRPTLRRCCESYSARAGA